MNWEVLITILGTILGSQTVTEIIRWLKNRKTDSRIEEAHADSEEFNGLRETLQFLQDQLKAKEERFAGQTDLVRNLNTEVIQLTREKATVELEYARYKADTELELEKVRCEDKPCPWRRPPNAYTELKPQGVTKEEYQNEKINSIIIHCSATKEGRDYTVMDIDRWHRARNFACIGYHYVIYRDGSIHEGRPIGQVGAHCLGHNTESIGICYIGGLDENGKPKDTRTPQQRAALIKLVKDLQARYNIQKQRIYGHCEFADKACPCFDVKKEFRV